MRCAACKYLSTTTSTQNNFAHHCRQVLGDRKTAATPTALLLCIKWMGRAIKLKFVKTEKRIRIHIIAIIIIYIVRGAGRWPNGRRRWESKYNSNPNTYLWIGDTPVDKRVLVPFSIDYTISTLLFLTVRAISHANVSIARSECNEIFII